MARFYRLQTHSYDVTTAMTPLSRTLHCYS